MRAVFLSKIKISILNLFTIAQSTTDNKRLLRHEVDKFIALSGALSLKKL